MMPLKRLACVAFFLTVPLWPVAFLLAAILALPEWILFNAPLTCGCWIFGDGALPHHHHEYVMVRRGLAPRVIAWANTKPPTKADRIAELERELGMVTS